MKRKGVVEYGPRAYDLFMWPMELLWFGRWRRRVLSEVRGNVLDIGSGTGTNFKYYPKTVKCVTVIDPSEANLRRLQERAGDNGWGSDGGRCLKIVIGVGERLPFRSGSFDYVVSTLILCSVEDPAKVISEGVRVLKRGGRFVFIEHQRPRMGVQGVLFDAVTPAWRRMSGCNLNRRTEEEIIRNSGLRKVDTKRWGVLTGYPFLAAVFEKV
ncbi:MAG: class I SAM-dependent methyltransferase [Thermoplasmatota archaeon]